MPKLNRIPDLLMNVALQPRRLAKSLSQRMSGSASTVLTLIALDGQWLKILHLDGPARSRRLLKAFALPVQGLSTEEIDKKLREVCTAEEFTPREVVVANPNHLCTVRLFSLPSVDPKEIRDIVELQAEKHTPYAKEEILMDFKMIERDRTGYSKVLLVIAHQDVINRPIRLAQRFGWMLERVGCELEGLVSWFRGVKRQATSGPIISMVLDVDGNTTMLVILQRGQPQFQRSLDTGIEQLERDPAQANSRLLGELQRSLEALEGEGVSGKVQEVLLTGPIDRLGGLKTHLEQGLGIPVALVSPWQGCEVSDAVKESLSRLPDVSFASLIGLARDLGTIDLTPQATKLGQALEERAKALVMLGMQFMGALLLVCFLLMSRDHKARQQYRSLQQLYQAVSPEAMRMEQGLQQLAFVDEQMRHRGELLRAIDALVRVAPPEIEWRSMVFTTGEAIVLHATSDQLPKVYEFSAGVTASPLFGEAEPRRVTKRREGEKDVTDFEMRCPLSGPEKPEVQGS